MRYMIRAVVLALGICLCATTAAADDRLSVAGHINAQSNRMFALIKDSCLPNAVNKIVQLRNEGFKATLMIVRKHGSKDTHAIVRLLIDGTPYYLDNVTSTMATKWYELYDLVKMESGNGA